MTDLHGKWCVVTGASRGLGHALTHALATRGANVIASHRDQEFRLCALSQTVPATLRGAVRFEPLDLSDDASVKRFAGRVAAITSRVDLLVNNAGVCLWKCHRTDAGLERTFSVNYLGHFRLTQLLLPLLRTAGRPQVINIASMTHAKSIDFEDIQGLRRYRMSSAYTASKLMLMMFAKELARREPGICAISTHPGFLRTSIGTGNPLGWLASRLCWPFAEPAKLGAERVLRLAFAEDVIVRSGSYYDRTQVAALPAFANDARNLARLWDLSTTMAHVTP